MSSALSAFVNAGLTYHLMGRAIVLIEMINDPNSEKSQRAMGAMLKMKKIDIDELKRAYAG